MFRLARRDLAFPIGGALAQFAILVLGGLAYTAVIGGSSEQLVTAMLIDAVMVVGLQIYIGNTGVLSFGHIGFGAVAGYAFAVLAIAPARKSTVIRNAPWGLADVHLSPTVAGLVAVGVTLVVAVVVGLGLARSGASSGAVSATVITLALLFVTHELAINWTDLTGGDRAGLSFSIGTTLDSRWPIYLALVAGPGDRPAVRPEPARPAGPGGPGGRSRGPGDGRRPAGSADGGAVDLGDRGGRRRQSAGLLGRQHHAEVLLLRLHAPHARDADRRGSQGRSPGRSSAS